MAELSSLRSRLARLEALRAKRARPSRADALRRARERLQELDPSERDEQWLQRCRTALVGPDQEGRAGRIQRARRRVAVAVLINGEV